MVGVEVGVGLLFFWSGQAWVRAKICVKKKSGSRRAYYAWARVIIRAMVRVGVKFRVRVGIRARVSVRGMVKVRVRVRTIVLSVDPDRTRVDGGCDFEKVLLGLGLGPGPMSGLEARNKLLPVSQR